MINIILAIFQILIAVGIIGFWISFFSGDAESNMSELEYKHEKSFPLPDLAWVTPNLLIAAIGLFLGLKWGFFFSATAGSGMMFLGLIDLAFNAQNGKFKRKDSDAYLSIFLVIVLLIFGPIFIVYGALNLL